MSETSKRGVSVDFGGWRRRKRRRQLDLDEEVKLEKLEEESNQLPEDLVPTKWKQEESLEVKNLSIGTKRMMKKLLDQEVITREGYLIMFNQLRWSNWSRVTLIKSSTTIILCQMLVASFLLLLLQQVTLVSSDERLLPNELAETVLPEFTPTRAPITNRQSVTSERNEPKTAGSSSKFVRTNELDTFLDDMNHNELRAVASGKPIVNLFHEKVVDKKLPDNMSQHSAGGENQGSPQRASATSEGGGLEGSHSERQIYSECALILQRTYVKNIDDPKHQLVPFGKTEQACISYKHIDKAIEQAKHKLKFRELAKKRRKQSSSAAKKLPPFEIIHQTLEPPEDLIAAIGEINMATTQILADQFDLSNDELLNGLPLIDMSKTKFWPMCPLLVRQDIECEKSRFRTFTGHCNNIKHPTWGAAMTPYARYLPPVHPDGIWLPRKSIVTEVTFDISPNHRETHSNISPSMPHPVFHDHMNHMNNLASAASVQFIRHAHLDAAADEAAMMAEHAAANGLPTPVPPPIGERIIDSHYQLAASVATTTTHGPMRTTSGADHHELTLAATPQIHHHHARTSSAVDLPSARLVTSVVHRDFDLPNHDFSILFMGWGQLLNHDMTRAAQPPSTIKCCPKDGQTKNKLCLPIQVPANDPFYSRFNVDCLEFRRTLAGIRPNCVLGPRVHQNSITHLVDASFVYGSSQAQADSLRLFKGGRLRDRNWFKREGLKPLLPAQEINPDQDCLARPKDLFCFLAGDVRANEQTHLTVLHTIYMRDHNRYADKLADLNPHWDDERIYQEARHIVAAGYQHVFINEYIPLLIGKKMTELYNLTAQPHDLQHHHHRNKHSYWHGYDPTVTTSVSNSFAAAAFRQGHTFVQGTVERYNKIHEYIASEKLRNLFKQPFLLYQPGVIDELVIGSINQPSQGFDPFMSEEVAGHLFQPPESQFGNDLASINIQRGREQGLPGYNLFREWCGLPRAETFDQLEPYLTNHTAYHYSRLYKHVDDIDLWSGGISERKLPGAAIGPTFACIIARQFSNTRRGDRFWYENPGLPSSFTPDQLAEIRKFSLAKLLCANSDHVPTIQRWAMRMPHPVLNPRIPCEQLPEPDLQYWQEE